MGERGFVFWGVPFGETGERGGAFDAGRRLGKDDPICFDDGGEFVTGSDTEGGADGAGDGSARLGRKFAGDHGDARGKRG